MAYGSVQKQTFSFGATGTSSSIAVGAGELIDFSVSGTFVGTLQIQRRKPGDSTWLVIESHTGAAERVLRNASNYDMRVECSAYTSGTAAGYIETSGERGV